MARNGLGYEQVRALNPSIVSFSSCNMGQTGLRAAQRGFGSQLTSQAGFTYLTGYSGEDPMLLFGPYIDFVAVGFGLIAVLAALDYRRRTGRGQYIDLAQYEAGLQFVAPALLEYGANGRIPTRMGNRSPHTAPHGAYPCRGEDRWCVIAVCTEDDWRAFCRATGHPEWGRMRGSARSPSARRTRTRWTPWSARGRRSARRRRSWRPCRPPACPRERCTGSATSSPTPS